MLRNTHRHIVPLIFMAVLSLQHAIAATPPPESEDRPMVSEAVAHAIPETFLYRTAISQPPIDNPAPVPAQTGDEIIEVAYADQDDTLYDVQLNLTRATAKVLQGGVVVGYGTLTPQEVTTLREAGQITAASSVIVEAIVVGIIVAIVEVAITISYEEFSRERDCQRGVVAGNIQIVRDIRACQRQGRGFVIHDSTTATCGAGAGATCH